MYSDQPNYGFGKADIDKFQSAQNLKDAPSKDHRSRLVNMMNGVEPISSASSSSSAVDILLKDPLGQVFAPTDRTSLEIAPSVEYNSSANTSISDFRFKYAEYPRSLSRKEGELSSLNREYRQQSSSSRKSSTSSACNTLDLPRVPRRSTVSSATVSRSGSMASDHKNSAKKGILKRALSVSDNTLSRSSFDALGGQANEEALQSSASQTSVAKTVGRFTVFSSQPMKAEAIVTRNQSLKRNNKYFGDAAFGNMQRTDGNSQFLTVHRNKHERKVTPESYETYETL
ncbi:MAG: hypothetical protein SGCHY_002400 [Lobulomycetales sp.]